MRKTAFKIMMILILSLGVQFCGCADDDSSDEGSKKFGDDDLPAVDSVTLSDDDDSNNTDYPFCQIDEEYIEELITQMPLRKKIAQMYALPAPTVPWFNFGDGQRFVQEVGAGAIFVQPGTSIGLWPQWTVQSINKIQTWALDSEFGIPVLVVCDQEGGIPQAISTITGGTDTPGNLGLGATFDPEASYQSYNLMGQQLSTLGINNAYAPVAGLMISPEESSMYTRCFGEDTDLVAQMVAKAVRGFQMNRVIATAKHFPSHSTAGGDEHWGPVYNTESQAAVRTQYFPPFQSAVDSGVDMIMTTHAIYSAWADLPATFNRELLVDVLRGEMGFEGIIITDDMNMGSITNMPWDEHPHVKAVAAGVDMIIDVGGDGESTYGMDPANEQWAQDVQGQIDAIEAAVLSGKIDEAQINDSMRRILRAKMKYCMFETPFRDPDFAASQMSLPKQEELSRDLHAKAITLVRNDDNLWPLDVNAGTKIHVVSISPYQSQMYPDAFWGNLATSTLLWEMQKIDPTITGDLFDVEPGNWTINRIVQNAQAASPDVLVIGSYHGNYHTKQVQMINDLLALNIPTILVALALPYDLLAFPEVTTYLAVYSNRNIAVEIAAKALFGQVTPSGRLPISLPGMYNAGHKAN